MPLNLLHPLVTGIGVAPEGWTQLLEIGQRGRERGGEDQPLDELHCPVVKLLEVIRGEVHLVGFVSCQERVSELVSEWERNERGIERVREREINSEREGEIVRERL